MLKYSSILEVQKDHGTTLGGLESHLPCTDAPYMFVEALRRMEVGGCSVCKLNK